MKTLLGELKRCPRCKTPFAEGEEQRCRVEGCNWPWPTQDQLEFIEKVTKTDVEVCPWVVGQVWVTEHGYLMRVESVRLDGIALIAMIEPYKTGPHTQKLVPHDWHLKTEAKS